MSENSQARRTRRWAVPTHLSGLPVLKGQWRDSPETKAREPQRPGAAPLWGWKTGVQNGSLLGLGDWGCRVASLQGQVARAAVPCPLSFPLDSFKGHCACSGGPYCKETDFPQTTEQSPPSCCPPFVLKRSWAPWVVTKTPYPPLQGCVPRSTDTRLIVPTLLPPSECGGGAG